MSYFLKRSLSHEMISTLLSTTTAGEKGNHEIVHFKLRLSVIGIIDQTEVKMNFKVNF